MIPALARRVLARIEVAEAREIDPWFRDDYRISWITVMNAARGVAEPHVAATYAVLGLHPQKVWPAIVARRKAQLGPLYEEFYGVSLPPKNPCRSEKRKTARTSEIRAA